MADDRPPYTHVSSWVKLFREDPAKLLAFMREWQDNTSWLIYRPKTHQDDDYLHQRIEDFGNMGEVLIAWGDQTIHADMSPIQDLYDRVTRFTLEVDETGEPFFELPTTEDVMDTWMKSILLMRRLELAASIALGVPVPLPKLNETEEHIQEIIDAQPGIGMKELAEKAGIKAELVRQYLTRLSRLGRLGYGGRPGRSGYWPPSRPTD